MTGTNIHTRSCNMAFDSDHHISVTTGNEKNQMRPIVPMIVRVFGDGVYTDVPVTPATTCADLIDCCRDPGDEKCELIGVWGNHGEWPLKGDDRPLEILQRWGSDKDSLKLVLRYTVLDHLPSNGVRPTTRHGMKEPGHLEETLPEGVQLTLTELREMACRQQQQIDSQHQLLAAKEQRLRYLKEQEARHQRVAAENERLRRLRERVEAQELKLRKLRALRGQVDQNKQNNVSLTSDLDSIRALFNEKEKELSLAVAKVDELTRQLEELRRGRPSSRDQTPSAAALELDKLRRELMYRNKLNEQQNARLCQQREALTARQEEMTNIDKRISELQDRLHRKRILNQQLANQITAASHKAVRPNPGTNQQIISPVHNGLANTVKQQPAISRGNIAAVEPYKHVPQQQPQQQEIDTMKGENLQEFLPEFGASKSDPKYQTLPYNTKFTVNFVTHGTKPAKDSSESNNWSTDADNNNQNAAKGQQHMTVHSTPLSVINKSLATPLNQNDPNKQQPPRRDLKIMSNGDASKNKMFQGGNNQMNNISVRGQPVGQPASTIATATTSSTTQLLMQQMQQQKPVSSVAPTSVNKQLSNIYQTSSMKIQPVQPQTLITAHHNQQQQLLLSPPQSTSTPLDTPEISAENKVPKPALPPKPSIKPPPRLTHPPGSDQEQWKENELTQLTLPESSGNPEELSPPLPQQPPPSENVPAIKAKPLTIKKQSLGGEQPRLRSLNSGSKLNGYHISINRRIEMPPAFLFPETDSPPADLVGNGNSNNSNNNNNNDPIASTGPSLTTALPATKQQESPDIDDISESSKENSSPNLTSAIDRVNALNSASDVPDSVVMRVKKGNLKQSGKANLSRRVSFDPLALLLDASLEGELELVKKTATQVPNPSAANDEGITALHNAICAGHLDIVKFLVEYGCDVNAQDSDGWTPLHCAASCNNVAMVRFLVEHGACIFATTLSDHETAAEKCEEDEEGFDGCSEYLYSVQEKLGILNSGAVYAVFDYTAQQPDELTFTAGQQLTVLRKGDEHEREWWWARLGDHEGYVPRNLLGLCPRVTNKQAE